MKIARKIVIILILMLMLVGCSFSQINNESSLADGEKIKLNLSQSQLIADFTGNEKYLNKDILGEIDVLDDDDVINVIVTLEKEGLSDSFTDYNYDSVSEYADSKDADKEIRRMKSFQEDYASALLEKNYINKVNHSYTALFNGFSATTTYGQFKKLQKAGYDIDLTISEVYSKPEVETKSFSSYETVINYVDVYGTGIFNSSGVGYDGGNTAVAILDSGFDIHHTVFQNMPNDPMISMEEVQDVLYETKAYNYTKAIKVQDVYVNSKIPFAFDYADKDPDVAPYDSNHGTHVAGIIGGKDDVITGVAVNTQLVLMKVFGDVNNGALQDDILAALEDALLLGVDAINLSLGTSCGFSRSSDEEYINVVYDKIEAAGISLIVAASNDYSSGYGGENSNTNKASNPDSATVGSPGSYTSTFSVASISGVKSKYIVAEDGYTFFYNNANDNAGKPFDFYDMLFENVNSSKQSMVVEYVTVPGVGKKVNYSNVDVEGKIALVKRGDITFEEKAQIALSQGAIGCIIYNNVAGEVYMNAGSGLKIALCSISKDDGEYLAQKGSGFLTLNKSYLAGPFMSDFSSWGPVSDLSLKPEITAHGGSILSSVPGGGYEEISGTSMACPNLCGVVILIRQALKDRYPDITPVELNNLANKLLMSTSTIILNEEGNPYSPRKQGSGLGNLKYALDTLAYLSVDGSTKSKIELKDDPNETGVYELVFNINNISDKELKYVLGNKTMTESLSTSDPRYVAEKAYMLNPTTTQVITGDGSIDENNVITVKANGTVTVKYTIKLTDAEKKYIQRSFPNGIYVEGFATLDSLNEDDIDLSIPFLAFYGDWTVAPMFDKTYYEVESEAHNGAIDEDDKLKADYYATTPYGTLYYSYIVPLGTYVYEMDETKYDKIPASEEHAAIGYNFEGINGITTVYAGLLRNAKKMTTTITNVNTGEVVYDHIKYDEHKAYFGGQIIPGYDLINITSESLGLQNNTQYSFKMKAELDYGDGGLANNLNNEFEFKFYVDFESPLITNAEFYTKYDKSKKENRFYVDVYVYDNHYAQSIRPFTIVNGKLTSLTEYVIPIYATEKGGTTKVTIEITDYLDLIKFGVLEDGTYTISNGFGFLVDDYALNQSYQFVSLPGTDPTIDFNSDYSDFKDYNIKYITGTDIFQDKTKNSYYYNKRLKIGDTLDLTGYITSDDPRVDLDPEIQKIYYENLNWTSSNEEVIKVKDGKIEAVGSGKAKVTFRFLTSGGIKQEVELSLEVGKTSIEVDQGKVEELEFLYFDTLKAFVDGPEISEIGETGERFFFTEKPIISCYPSEQVQIGYKLDPWNLKNYETIWSSSNEKVATVDENGVVTALKEGSATITLKVKINGKTSSIMASARVSVKSEFVIEGNTLVAYKGAGGDVVIPDDEGILYIGSFAFSLYTTDYEIKIEEDRYDDAKTPDKNDTITSVVIPGDVQEVKQYAFYNCTILEKVTFLSNTKGKSCPIIRDYAFAGDKALTTINLEQVEIVGKCAFKDCDGLVDIDTSNIYAMGEQAFADCDNLKFVDISGLRNAAKEVFINCKSLASIESDVFTNFSEGMFKNSGLTNVDFKADRIPNRCFENCKDLVNVMIEKTLVYVGEYAFDNCSSLEKVQFSDESSCEFIYKYAFNDCSNLKTIYLPNSETIYEEYIFNNCVELEEVVFNEYTYIKNNLGSLFNKCNKLTEFTVNEDNSNYKFENSLLLSKDGTEIILAVISNNYGDYVIPSSVTKIGEGAFSAIENLVVLTINSNVTEIGYAAFENCVNLQTVNLPLSNITVGAKAFNGCTSLETVNNLNSVEIFNEYVFASTKLTSINVENKDINEGAFSNISTLKEVKASGNIIGDYAFINAVSLETAIIDYSEIGKYAFGNAEKLSSLDLTNVLTIKEGAFKGCLLITKVESETVQSVEGFAFSGCANINSVVLPNVLYIGDCAFSSLPKDPDSSVIIQANVITELVFGDSLEYIGNYAFYGSLSLEKVITGDGLSEIGAYAFGNCRNLVEFKSNGNVENINECAFYRNNTLSTFDVQGIKYVGDGAFFNNFNLVNIDLSEALEIGVQAFAGCTSLESLNLNNVIKLNDGAFLACSKLTNIELNNVEYLGFQALSSINVSEIVLSDSIKYISETAFASNYMQTVFKDKDGNINGKVNDYILLDDGVLYTITENGKYMLHSYPTGKQDTEYEVLFDTVRIEEYAGYLNPYITKVIFPDTLEIIGNMCFYGCDKLKTVEFNSTIAPVLEGTASIPDIEYEYESEIYNFVSKYFNLNGYISVLFYGQFKDMVGLTEKLNIVISSNANVSSYQTPIYNLYFNWEEYDYENMENNEKFFNDYEALDEYSLDYLNKVSLIPDEVLIIHGNIIMEAKTSYNLLKQDLTKYGYSQEYLDSLYNKLIKAEETWNELNDARIQKTYKYLIEEIQELGPDYSHDKIKLYNTIIKEINLISKEEKRYLDISNVESFKDGLDQYFKDLSDEIDTIENISTLPITSVNKVGMTIALATTGAIAGLTLLGIIIKKRFF